MATFVAFTFCRRYHPISPANVHKRDGGAPAAAWRGEAPSLTWRSAKTLAMRPGSEGGELEARANAPAPVPVSRASANPSQVFLHLRQGAVWSGYDATGCPDRPEHRTQISHRDATSPSPIRFVCDCSEPCRRPRAILPPIRSVRPKGQCCLMTPRYFTTVKYSRPPFPNLKLCLASTINIPLGNFIAKTLPEVSWHGMQLWISSIQLSQVFLHLLNSYTAKSRLIFVLYAIAL